MDSQEDDDIGLQRASRDYIKEAKTLLRCVLWKHDKDAGGEKRVHRLVRKRDLDRIIQLVKIFLPEH